MGLDCNSDSSFSSGFNNNLFQPAIHQLAAQISRFHFYIFDGRGRDLEKVVREHNKIRQLARRD